MSPPAADGSVTTQAAEVATGESGAPAGAQGTSLRSLGGRARSVYIVYAIVVLFYAFARFTNGSYGSNSFYISVVTLGVFVVVSGLGQTVVMLSGGFDLSIPGTITLAGILLMGFSGLNGSGAAWAIPAVLCIGLAVGLANGIGVVALGLSPIVTTLAMYTILEGVVLVYTQGTPQGATPSVIIRLVQGSVGGVPRALIVFAVVAVVGIVGLNFTSFGRRLYAVGSSPRAATLAGISVRRITVAAYVLSGLAAAVGGILLSGYANRAFLGMGDPYLMLSLAAAVVGGISVRGGRGYFAGTVGAALILMIVTGVLASTSLPDAVDDIVLGVIIIGVVVVARHESGT
jgi:ribose transport system permease protein